MKYVKFVTDSGITIFINPHVVDQFNGRVWVSNTFTATLDNIKALINSGAIHNLTHGLVRFGIEMNGMKDQPLQEGCIVNTVVYVKGTDTYNVSLSFYNNGTMYNPGTYTLSDEYIETCRESYRNEYRRNSDGY